MAQSHGPLVWISGSPSPQSLSASPRLSPTKANRARQARARKTLAKQASEEEEGDAEEADETGKVGLSMHELGFNQ